MASFNDKCIEAAEWIESITGIRPEKEHITLEDLGNICDNPNLNGGDDGLPNHWDYPLSETAMLATDDGYEFCEFVLVRFYGKEGEEEKFVYRWCES